MDAVTVEGKKSLEMRMNGALDVRGTHVVTGIQIRAGEAERAHIRRGCCAVELFCVQHRHEYGFWRCNDLRHGNGD